MTVWRHGRREPRNSMAGPDRWEKEQIEVRWIRSGGIVVESLTLTLERPEQAAEGLETAWAALIEWRNHVGR